MPAHGNCGYCYLYAPVCDAMLVFAVLSGLPYWSFGKPPVVYTSKVLADKLPSTRVIYYLIYHLFKTDYTTDVAQVKMNYSVAGFGIPSFDGTTAGHHNKPRQVLRDSQPAF
jgi:hypothetical protein